MTPSLKTNDMYSILKNNFLYKNDMNSIYILLALYDVEENISNIYPTYMCFEDIKRKVKRVLKDREDVEHLSHDISVIMHEDINRLELCFYLEGYKDGFKNKRYANILEKEVVKNYGINYLYNKKEMGYFNKDSVYEDIKTGCFKYIDEKKVTKNEYLKELANTFIDRIIKKKIENLDEYVDKQLRFSFDSVNIIEEIDYKLSDDEILKINTMVFNSMILNLLKAYKDAFWIAVNDNVFRRYR